MKVTRVSCIAIASAVFLGCGVEGQVPDEPGTSAAPLIIVPLPLPPYSVSELPAGPGGTRTVARAIGSNERIVGAADFCTALPPVTCNLLAAFWDPGQAAVKIPQLPNTKTSVAVGITDAGVIIGTSVDVLDKRHGWRFSVGSGTTELFGPGGAPLLFTAAASNGWTTGTFFPPGQSVDHAFRHVLGSGVVEDLYPACVRTVINAHGLGNLIPPGYPANDCLNGTAQLLTTHGFAVDVLGNVAGKLEIGNGQFFFGAFWRGGFGPEAIDLHGLNNSIDVKEATAVSGTVLGPYIGWDGSERTWSWSTLNGSLLGDMGLPVSARPLGLSSNGRMVGYRTTAPQLPVTYRQGSLTNLPVPLGLSSGSAGAVNRCGNIAGNAYDAQFRNHGLRWTKANCD